MRGIFLPPQFTVHDCNPLEDYDIAAAWTTIGSYFIVVSPDSPYKTLDDLIADCKARPGQITFAIQIGSMSHYFIEEVASKAGIKFKYVEAGTGDSERIVALMGGHVDVSLINPAQTTQYVKAGELVALASLMKNSEDADPSIKNVPVVSASGIDEGTLATMFVIALPKGTDPEVLQAMSDAYKAAQADSELQQKLKNANMETALFYEYGKAKDAVIAMYNTFSQLAGTFGIKAPGR